jgi:hypothetical protein
VARVLLSLDVLVSYRREEAFLAALFALVLATALAATAYGSWRGRRAAKSDGLLLASLVLGAAVFLVPNRLGGGSWMTHRLALWTALAGALWIAARCQNAAGRRILWSTGLLVALGLLGLRSTSYLALAAEIEEVVALGSHLSPHEVLVPVRFAPRGRDSDGRALSGKTKPLLHVAGHLAARQGVINLGNYQPRTGHFPIRLKPEVDSRVDTLLGIEGMPTKAEVAAARRFDPGEAGVDVVLVTGLAPLSSVSPEGRAVLESLGQGLGIRAVSSPRGTAVLLGKGQGGLLTGVGRCRHGLRGASMVLQGPGCREKEASCTHG